MMHVLGQIVAFIASAVLGFIFVVMGFLTVLVFVVGIFFWIVSRQFKKIVDALDVFKWYTLEEALALGLKEKWLRRLIPVMCRLPTGESRIREHLSEADLSEATGKGFVYSTVHLYEFRMVVKGDRRRIRQTLRESKDWFPSLTPQTT